MNTRCSSMAARACPFSPLPTPQPPALPPPPSLPPSLLPTHEHTQGCNPRGPRTFLLLRLIFFFSMDPEFFFFLCSWSLISRCFVSKKQSPVPESKVQFLENPKNSVRVLKYVYLFPNSQQNIKNVCPWMKTLQNVEYRYCQATFECRIVML